ncbi:MAG: OmpW/AlkL family protein [Caulobacteraceae bacterium]
MTACKRSHRLGAIACGLTLALAASAAQAQDQDYRPHAGMFAFKLGGGGILFNSGGKLRLAGQPLPGADLKVSNNGTAIFEGEYYFHRDVSLSVTVGVPPTLTATGKGTLAPLGTLGSVQYGPGAVLAKYHFSDLGRFQPYLGGGVTRMLIFDEKDGAITRLNVHPSWGGAVQAGADYMLTPRWGAFASVSHLFLRTHGEGVFSGLPVQAEIALDPTIVMGGLTFRY